MRRRKLVPNPISSSSLPLLLLLLMVVILQTGHTIGLTAPRQPRRRLSKQPNIVFVLADDYGYNDIGYHGSDISTPNLDELSAKGVRLENYYVQPSCSPSRSQFLSGRYQIHTGLQHSIIWSTQPNALPDDSPTIAHKLREAGYATHMVGKWHVGFYKPRYIPINRGFDTFYGFYTGYVSYYTHSRPWSLGGPWYVDLHDQDRPALNESGHYSTHLFTQKAVQRIRSHDQSKPLFLYLSYQAVHTPMEVPDSYTQPFQHLSSHRRIKYAGMVAAMDEGIGNVTRTLKEMGMWDNTVFVFSSDNGGTPEGGANNYPLRGGKGTLWEGGMRVAGFVTAPRMRTAGQVSSALMHITDWFPTFVRLAGGSLNGTLSLDGFDQWDAICNGQPSARREILHNIDILTPLKGRRRLYGNTTFDNRVRAAIRYGDWKLITGHAGHGGWNMALPVSRQNETAAGHPVNTYSYTDNLMLFNVKDDPREFRDLSGSHPQVVKVLLDRLLAYNATVVPPRYPPRFDPKSHPKWHGNVWEPWVADDGEIETYQIEPLEPSGPSTYVVCMLLLGVSCLLAYRQRQGIAWVVSIARRDWHPR